MPLGHAKYLLQWSKFKDFFPYQPLGPFCLLENELGLKTNFARIAIDIVVKFLCKGYRNLINFV